MVDLVIIRLPHVWTVETGWTANHGHRLSRTVVAGHTDVASTALEEVFDAIDGREGVVVFNGSPDSGLASAVVASSTRGRLHGRAPVLACLACS